ncbi:hypothetical protein [Flavobacterium sp.]|uniref:hypothetical protein n=1 Tax=Flavobacterium sp. TaxID=239 RepID=UPI002622A9A6|nr:hypothetical protein [Flavobacterium sp.]
MIFRYIVLFLAFLFISCKENAAGEYASVDYYFDEPQPVNNRPLKTIPTQFRGSYSHSNDEVLNITDKAVYFDYQQNIALPLSEKDSLFKSPQYKDGKITYYNPYSRFDVTVKDSVYLSGFTRDSIFNLSDTNIAKLYKGRLILSHRDSIFWKVNILAVSKDSLYWKHLSLEDYKNISVFIKDFAVNNDTIGVLIKPTKKEFKQLLDMNMSWQRRYKRVRG